MAPNNRAIDFFAPIYLLFGAKGLTLAKELKQPFYGIKLRKCKLKVPVLFSSCSQNP
jgi:hypothetical protein